MKNNVNGAIRQRILNNASKQGKEAFPVTTLGVAMVTAALRQAP